MEKTLKIYYTSDTHGRLFPEDSGKKPCLTQDFASYQKDENTLILDGGDTLQGSPLLRYLWKSEQCPAVVSAVMNSSGMDYYTLGNHDFNYGYAGLAGYVRRMQATCLTANVQDAATQNGDLPPMNIQPYAVHTLGNGLRIGLVGIVTDNVTLWEAEENLVGLTLTDAYEAAKTALEQVRAVEGGVDYTICIYHGGFEEDLDTGKYLERAKENIACKICKMLDFDLMLTAHQHMEQPLRKVYNTYVLQLPPNAEKYAALQIGIDTDPAATAQGCEQTAGGAAWRVLGAAHCVASAQPDAALLAQMKPIRDAAANWLAQPVGSLATPAPAVEDKIELATGASLVAQLANFAQMQASGAEVAITSLPNHAVGLPAAVTIGDVLTAYPFPNEVMTFAMSGEILAQGIARSASYLAKDASGALCVATHFMKPKQEHYNYDFFGGVSYRVAFLAGETKPTVTEILVNGAPLDPARVYKVVMSDYRATGTGGYGFYTSCDQTGSCPCDLQALILETLANNPNFEIPVLSQVTIAE